MKIWDEILISIIFILAFLCLFGGLKKMVPVFVPKARTYSEKKSYGRSGVFKFLTNKYRTNKKILTAIIFTILTLFFYLLCRNLVFSLFIGICLEIYILDVLRGLEEKRKNLLHGQLLEFISNMTVMLKAGKTVRSIFKDSIGWFKDPLNTYLVEAVNDLELNSTLDEVLNRFSQKCGSREADLLVCSLKINNKIGGDLVSILANIADTIRHNLKLKSQTDTMSLQSRYSGNIISIFPVIVLIILCVFMNKAIFDFFSTGIGIILLFIGGVMEIAGIVIMKKITSVPK